MSNLLNYGDVEADYVLTEEEEKTLRSEESQAEIKQNVDQLRTEQIQQQAEAQAAEQAEAAPTPQTQQPSTEGQQPQQQTPATSTEEPFDTSKDYSYYAARGMSRKEWNRLQLSGGVDSEMKGFYEDPKSAFELATAVPTGLLDFGIDAANTVLSPSQIKLPKITPYENGIAQAVRQITSVIGPTMGLQGLGMKLGAMAQSRVGWSLGNTAFMRFLGSRGIEAGSSVAVGAVSSEYEGDNALGSLKKALPPQWDYIPDNWATLEGDSTDIKRQKNINEDLATGFIIPFVQASGKFLAYTGILKRTLDPKTGIYKDAPEIVAKSKKAQNFLDGAKPVDDSDELTSYALKQEEALDELGAYNLSENPEMNVALKGVHDLFDWNEIGQRTVDDFGIVGASLDAVRIAKNYDTVYGRLGNMISPPAIRYAGKNATASEEIVLGLTKQLKDADEYGMQAKNWSISFDDVIKQGDNLSLELFDPSMGIKELREMLDPYIVKSKDGVEYVAEDGYASLFNAISGMSKEYTGADIARTQAYLATSLAGQISDIAEGVRINAGSNAVFGARERIKDNLMYLMKLQGVTRYYADKKSRTKNVFERLLANGQKPKVDADADELPRVLNNIQREVETLGQNLDYLNTYFPKTAEALLELYELSDGKINSITKLTEDINHSFLRHAPLIDSQPDAPNILAQAVRANWYNSMLSAIGTASTALFGQLGGIISEPVSYFAGAVAHADLDAIQRGWMAYSAVWETQRKAMPHAGKMFMKASQKPSSVLSESRLDFIIQQERKIEQYKKMAEEHSARGEHGLSYFVNLYESQMHMAQDPVFRLAPNTFTGFDGWSGATLANAEARFRAMSELKRLGNDISRDEVKRLASIEYNKMFDENGIIVDEAVKYNNSDISLNLDTQMVKAANKVMSIIPVSRMFFPMPTTLANVFKQGDNYLPLPFKSFQKDINELTFTPMEDFAVNPELVEQLLTSRGVNVTNMDEAARLEKLLDLKYKTFGRKATGTFLTGIFVTGMFLGQIELTGDGLYDRSAQRSRETNSDWERRTISVMGSPRIAYEKILGPGLSNWVATLANIVDNFDTIGEAAFENLMDKMAFILAGAVTDPLKSSLTPLTDLIGGENMSAVNRFAAGQINTLGPLGGMRNEMGRIIDGGLKLVEQDILSLIANRNQLVGVFDPVNRLPDLYSPVTGKIPNKYTLLQRVWNAWSPIKIAPVQSPEEKFLEQIEFDLSTTFKKRQGIELDTTEQSELFRLMGEQEYFKKRVRSIMNTAQSRNTIERLKKARQGGIRSDQVDLKDFDMIHYQLGVALREAKSAAYAALDSDMKLAIEARILARKQQQTKARMGIIPEVTSIRK